LYSDACRSSLEVNFAFADGNVHVDHTIERLPLDWRQTSSSCRSIESLFYRCLLYRARGI
jgi:prepilin-type processing-associated H-X9-DG protein